MSANLSRKDSVVSCQDKNGCRTAPSAINTFFYFVYGFGDVNRLFQFHWAFDVPTLDAVIGLIVQGVYCWRIWKLSGWGVVPILLGFVSSVSSLGRGGLDILGIGIPPCWCLGIYCRSSGMGQKHYLRPKENPTAEIRFCDSLNAKMKLPQASWRSCRV